ncbi:MAG TPA: DUF72 domain-containing protein [Blastocatellia bacterium]|nr:DUF72 domain-containing protein [Blastocatellia bacterium]
MEQAALRLGTCAFTAAGWGGTFYPPGIKSADYLSHYARHFDTVEVDSTFYGVPSAATTRNWYAQTPAGFLFAAKAPQTITHERCMVGCDPELKEFLSAMEPLGDKLGPLLFQFPYYSRRAFNSADEFIKLLAPFVKKLPAGYRFAVEIRNRWWIEPKLLDVLRERAIALALIDHPWMPRPAELLDGIDPVTSDFTYIRWLGDRKGIEEITKSWDKVVVDRKRELEEWVEACRGFAKRSLRIFGYANNHYAGNGPSTVRLIWELWDGKPREIPSGYPLGF